MSPLFDQHCVYLSSSANAGYSNGAGKMESGALPADELPARTAIRKLWTAMGLDLPHLHTNRWNPLGQLLGEGRRVLIKPNWVRHAHTTGGDLDCLITHTSVIDALLQDLVKTNPRRLVVGDAPLQGCDFATLRSVAGLDLLQQRYAERGTPIEVIDFRRTIRDGDGLQTRQHKDCRDLDRFVLFDLAEASSLEPLSSADAEFRVTQYDPRRLQATHGPGRHQYLVAREVLEAEVVINVPKLKTHKKSGITGALKNLVGINGHKEYLPHHRRGSPAEGGDCYPQTSWLKRYAETCLDAMNVAQRPASRRLWELTASVMLRSQSLLGGDGDVEGSWHGNDTIWRTCLDLQRILHFGRLDGTLAEHPQRQVLHVTDAIVAGEGEGPLSPDPVPLGIISCGTHPAAVEWVHAWLMGFDPASIPLIREACASSAFPGSELNPDRIRVFLDGQPISWEELDATWSRSFRAPAGWRGHCERRPHEPASKPARQFADGRRSSFEPLAKGEAS